MSKRDIALFSGRVPSGFEDEDAWYWLGPIHTELLALTPGDRDSFTSFAKRLGCGELMEAVHDRSKDPESAHYVRDILFSAFTDEDRTEDSLTEAWLHPYVVDEWQDIHQDLTDTIALLDTREPSAKFVASIDTYPPFKELLRVGEDDIPSSINYDPDHASRIELMSITSSYLRLSVAYDDRSGLLVEEPTDILSRAFFEVVEGDLLVRRCDHCLTMFVPSHGGMRFCRATCRLEYQKASKSSYSKGYQRMYKRKTRGTITQEEFDQWKQDNQWRKNAPN